MFSFLQIKLFYTFLYIFLYWHLYRVVIILSIIYEDHSRCDTNSHHLMLKLLDIELSSIINKKQNGISFQDVSDHDTLQICFFIIFELLCICRKYSGVVSCGLLLGFKYRVFVFLDWLVYKAREPTLLCYITHSRRESDIVHMWKCMQKTRPEFQLGLLVPLTHIN